MKYALVNGQRREAESGLTGACQFDGHPMVAKCGEIRRRHWAHHIGHSCDPWWDNETEWHRDWKGQFPVEWQEIVHISENGEKHIADVKTGHEWVLEFQHSHLTPDERQARNVFYHPKLVWVVDGTRRKRDLSLFNNALKDAVQVSAQPPILRLRSFEGTLFREWTDSKVPVFFDFGEAPRIWWLSRCDGLVYVVPFSRTEFVGLHGGGPTQTANRFEKVWDDLKHIVSRFNSQLRSQTLNQPALQPQYRGPQQPLSFQDWARQQRAQSRSRF